MEELLLVLALLCITSIGIAVWLIFVASKLGEALTVTRYDIDSLIELLAKKNSSG